MRPTTRRTLEGSMRSRLRPATRDLRQRQLPTVPSHAVPTGECQSDPPSLSWAIRCSRPRGDPSSRAGSLDNLLHVRASNEMPGVPEAAKIESSKDAGRPHTEPVCGRPRTPDDDDLQPASGMAGVLLGALYEGRPAVNRATWVHGSRHDRSGRASLISLSPPLRRTRRNGNVAPVAQLLEGRHAASRCGAPAGANGWLRVSMCQIASASLRAMSTWATLAPRCLPSRRLLRR